MTAILVVAPFSWWAWGHVTGSFAWWEVVLAILALPVVVGGAQGFAKLVTRQRSASRS